MQARPLAAHLRRGALSTAPGDWGLRGASPRGSPCTQPLPLLPPTPSDLQGHLLISSPNWIVGRQEELFNLYSLKCFHGRRGRREGVGEKGNSDNYVNSYDLLKTY